MLKQVERRKGKKREKEKKFDFSYRKRDLRFDIFEGVPQSCIYGLLGGGWNHHFRLSLPKRGARGVTYSYSSEWGGLKLSPSLNATCSLLTNGLSWTQWRLSESGSRWRSVIGPSELCASLHDFRIVRFMKAVAVHFCKGLCTTAVSTTVPFSLERSIGRRRDERYAMELQPRSL